MSAGEISHDHRDGCGECGREGRVMCVQYEWVNDSLWTAWLCATCLRKFLTAMEPVALPDVFDQVVDARLANSVRNEPGEPPTATLYEIVDAVRAHRDPEPVNGSQSIRIIPDPRLIAAVIACRDYDAAPSSGSIEPIIVLKDPRTGRAKALICVEYTPSEETES